MITAPPNQKIVLIETIPRMGDCPAGGDHNWVAEKTGVGIIYNCTKCGAGR